VMVSYDDDHRSNVNDELQNLLKETDLNFQIFDTQFVIIYKKDEQGLKSLRQMKNMMEGILQEEDHKKSDKSIALERRSSVPLLSRSPEYSLIDRRVVMNISGVVTDEQGEPLVGVNVQVKGSSIGTATDIDGKFIIEDVEDQAVLVVSYIGYQTQEINISGSISLSITLIADSQLLDEVVVVGYGTKRKRDITSAISVIDVENVGDVPASNASRLLQGQAAGVVVKQLTGTPGEQMNVIIRGVGSLGAGSDPLYVIDGFAVGTSIGENLNPNDIESISILKDAASTAIYGARGSNGVVLITTKNAKKGVADLSFTSYFGVQNLPKSRRINMMDGPQFARFLQESWMDRIRYFQNRQPSLDEVPEGIRYPEQTKYSTDWLDAITQ